jgi:hypothetical protein
VPAEELARLIDLYSNGGHHFDGDPFPVPARVAIRRRQLVDGLALDALVRARVSFWDSVAASHSAPEEESLREAYLDLGSFYIDLLFAEAAGADRLEIITNAQKLAFEQFNFLDFFYRDPEVVIPFAIGAFVRTNLMDLRATFKKLPPNAIGETFAEVEAPESYGSFYRRTLLMFDAVNQLADFGELPQAVEDAHGIPESKYIQYLVGNFVHLHARLTILLVYQAIPYLRNLAEKYYNIGTYVAHSQKELVQMLRDLQTELQQEFNRYPHANFNDKADDWFKRITDLRTEIEKGAHRSEVVATIVGQLPWIFVGGEFAAGIGAWVRTVTSARWVIALAEGTALTAFNLATAAPGMRPTTAAGWGFELAANIAWARIGRAVFDIAGEAAERLVASRRAFLRIGVEVVLPAATIATLQTAAQRIEAVARGQGGESDFTELLTVNLIMHGLGLMMSQGPATATEPRGSAIVRYRAEDLARVANLKLDAAQRWLDLANRSSEFQQRLAGVAARATRGTVTETEFKNLVDEGLKLADVLERDLPELAQALQTGQSPERIRAAIAQMKQVLRGLNYSALRQVRLLPEFVSGLRAVGDGRTFVFENPAHEPPGLQRLLTDYGKRGFAVRKLPGGGAEVLNAQGQITTQILPVSPEAVRYLPPPLEAIATSRQTRAGLDAVRRQTTAPELEALLSRSRARSGDEAVLRVLRAAGRFLDYSGSDTAWRGLDNYLRFNGDPATLARTLTFHDTQESAVENAAHVRNVLTQMAGWDATAVRGLEKFSALRPRGGPLRTKMNVPDWKVCSLVIRLTQSRESFRLSTCCITVRTAPVSAACSARC